MLSFRALALRAPSLARPSLDRRWIFFGLAALSLLMSSIDGTIVAVALPTFIGDLHAKHLCISSTRFFRTLYQEA